jgi:hypothetical protein
MESASENLLNNNVVVSVQVNSSSNEPETIQYSQGTCWHCTSLANKIQNSDGTVTTREKYVHDNTSPKRRPQYYDKEGKIAKRSKKNPDIQRKIQDGYVKSVRRNFVVRCIVQNPEGTKRRYQGDCVVCKHKVSAFIPSANPKPKSIAKKRALAAKKNGNKKN